MTNEIYEKLVKNYEAGKDAGGQWNPDLFRAYMDQDENNKLLDFSNIVSEERIPALVKELRRVGITEFTISSGWSSLIERLAVWEKEGAKICGTTTILHKVGFREEEEEKPALLMKLDGEKEEPKESKEESKPEIEKVTMNTRVEGFGQLVGLARDNGVVNANGNDFILLTPPRTVPGLVGPAFSVISAISVKVGEVVKDWMGEKVVNEYEVRWYPQIDDMDDPFKYIADNLSHPDTVHCTDCLVKVE